MLSTPDWSPFLTASPGERAPGPRGLSTPAGVADRLRTAAFAELQAREAFLWAAASFPVAEELKACWRAVAAEEDRHLSWLLARMKALGADPAERPVSTRLWEALSACRDAGEFAALMYGAEARAHEAEVRFRDALAQRDPATAAVFERIAREELGHLEAARRFFPALGA